ncbi:MAG: CbtA family protein [Aeromicrobium sp.]
MNPRTFLINGLIAGFIAGLFAFGVAHQVGEPYVDQSIAVEEAGSAATKDHDHGEEAVAGHSHGDAGTEVSRDNQSTFGLLTATLAIGTVLGGIAGLSSAFAVGRLGRLRPAASTALVAVVGFVSFALAGWAKYPPNPPGVGNGETIGSRTADYFTFQALSVLLAIGAVVLASMLARKHDGWLAAVLPALGWLVLITVVGLILPTVNEVPDSFPANTLWGFRLSAIATQATMWGTIGVVLSGLIARTWHAAEKRRVLADSIR